MAEPGPEALHGELARRAPWAAEKVDPRDRSRIVRQLELHDLGELEPPADDRPSRAGAAGTGRPARPPPRPRPPAPASASCAPSAGSSRPTTTARAGCGPPTRGTRRASSA